MIETREKKPGAEAAEFTVDDFLEFFSRGLFATIYFQSLFI